MRREIIGLWECEKNKANKNGLRVIEKENKKGKTQK
jgi:hypothetical protein